MSRPKRYVENMLSRFEEGTFAAIDGALQDGEDRAEFVRQAVREELKRRRKRPKVSSSAESSH